MSFGNKNPDTVEEKNNCFFIKNFFPPQITAGFSKPSLPAGNGSDFPKLFLASGKENKFSCMAQMHGGKIALAGKPAVYGSDGLFTKDKNHFLVIKSADCLPILLAGKNGWIGAVHMGWRSAKAGILENIPFDLSGFRAAAGPGLRGCCYRVGNEFEGFPRFFSYLVRRRQGLFFNPVDYARDQLGLKGLKKQNFLDLKICSFCSQSSFFSYRRNKTQKRTLSFIALSR